MKYHRITFRIPVDLHEELSDAAEENSRSMNAEIIARLRLANDFPPFTFDEKLPITESRLRQIISEELAKAGK